MKSGIEKKWEPNVELAWKDFLSRAELETLIQTEEVEAGDKESTAAIKSRRKRFAPWICSATTICIIVCILSFGSLDLFKFLGTPSFSDELITRYNEREGEALAVILPDGSMAFLFEGGLLTHPCSFQRNERWVILEGEAFFDVVEDDNLIFVVETKFVDIEVVGTSFLVRSDSICPFELTVQSGRVRATFINEDQEIIVEEGENVFLLDNGLQKSDIDCFQVNWNSKKIFFNGESLEQIVRVVNESIRGDKQIFIEDDYLKQRVITLSLFIESSESIANNLCNTLNLEQSIYEDVIYLSSK